MRTLVIVALWVLTLCFIDIYVRFKDGLEIDLKGWGGKIFKDKQ